MRRTGVRRARGVNWAPSPRVPESEPHRGGVDAEGAFVGEWRGCGFEMRGRHFGGEERGELIAADASRTVSLACATVSALCPVQGRV